jgi:hypothetical protein
LLPFARQCTKRSANQQEYTGFIFLVFPLAQFCKQEDTLFHIRLPVSAVVEYGLVLPSPFYTTTRCEKYFYEFDSQKSQNKKRLCVCVILNAKTDRKRIEYRQKGV